MVARMTELLELTPQSRVLEIGTGSGYQTAILAHLVQHVCSVERIKGLQWQARRRLKNLIYIMLQPVMAMDGKVGRHARRLTLIHCYGRHRSKFQPALMTQLDEGGILVLTRRGGAPVFETGASSGRRTYYRYRGGRALLSL